MIDTIRPYQQDAIDQIKYSFKKGYKKVLLWMATGSGKTFVFCRIVKACVAKGKPCIVVVRGRKLVSQASERLAKEGVEHSVLMAGHWNYRPKLLVQVCSIDTLIARELKPDASLIIIDECHMAVSKGYKKFLKQYDTFILSVTATPYSERGSLGHIAQTVVRPTSMIQLIEEGNLVNFKYFSAPREADFSGVDISKSTGDFVNNQLAEVMSTSKLVGDVVKNWKDKALNLPTLCFAVNVSHSKKIVQRFLDEGITAEHIDAYTKDEDRISAIKRLENGETMILSNCGVLCTGTDIPCVRAIILDRATMSYNLFVQICGRGTRPFPGKDFCILLDHGGNLARHEYPTDEPEPNLHGKAEKRLSLVKFCPECFYAFKGHKCPNCGYVHSINKNVDCEIEETEGELIEIVVEIDPVKRMYEYLVKEAKKTKKRKQWAYYKLIDKFGVERSRPFLPDYFSAKYEPKKAFTNSPYRAMQIF